MDHRKLTNSGTLVVNIGIEARCMLSISALSSLPCMMRLFNHVIRAHNLTVLIYLLEYVDVRVILEIHFLLFVPIYNL